MNHQHFINNQQQVQQQQQQSHLHHINQTNQQVLNRMPGIQLQQHGNIIQAQHQATVDQNFTVQHSEQQHRFNNNTKNLKNNSILSSSNNQQPAAINVKEANVINSGEATFFGPNLPNSGQTFESNQTNNIHTKENIWLVQVA